MCELSRIKDYYRRHNAGRVVQGDILKDIMFVEWNVDETDLTNIIFVSKTLPYIIVLSQDCDLDHDYKNRSDINAKKHDAYLQSILVCPAYLKEDFKDGMHLKDFDLIMDRKGGDLYKKIEKNIDPRYHFLSGDPQFQIPNMIIDFKHYYTLPVDFLYNIYDAHYVASLEELFRESLCQRFSFYLSRIGLPEIRLPELKTT